MSGVETWKNVTNGMAYILKNDRFGNETHELVNAGRSFSVTREERLLNMDRAASKSLDLFQNGTLVPVRLLEGDEEAHELASTPNLMAESEMSAIFKGHWKTFESKIAAIDNESTLNRLLEAAQAVDATVRQIGIIQKRLDEIAPKRFVEREVETFEALPGPVVGPKEDAPGRPVSPK